MIIVFPVRKRKRKGRFFCLESARIKQKKKKKLAKDETKDEEMEMLTRRYFRTSMRTAIATG